MKTLSLLSLFLLLPAFAFAQSAVELKQQPLSKWNIGSANYSGITRLGENRYALVSDKEPADGFFLFRIDQNAATGEVTNVYLEGFRGNAKPHVNARGISLRDCEGIAWFAPAATLFISGEGDQKILEYSLDGQPTGRKLSVPGQFALPNIVGNCGFEALTYSADTHLFWTTTETPLPADCPAPGPANPGISGLLRLQAFDDQLQPAGQYAYRMAPGRMADFGATYVHGVPALTALPDGRLLVLEREANITAGGLSSTVECKLFLVNPTEGHLIDSSVSLKTLDPNHFLVKNLLATWQTAAQPLRLNFANYEGMCLGRTLQDGRQTLLLVSDSQGGYHKGPFRLKDYLKVIVLGE